LELRAKQAETDLKLVNAALEAGTTAVKSVFLLNGGSAVAILAFLGKTIEQLAIKQQHLVGYALIVFGLGVFAAGAANGFRYLAQHNYSKEFQAGVSGSDAVKLRDQGDMWRGWTIGFTVAAFCLFLIGLGMSSAIFFVEVS